MLKSVFVFLLAMLFTVIANAQKKFNVTIKLDSSINPQKVHYQYYNGYDKVLLPDTFGNKRAVTLTDQYCSPFASVVVAYDGSDGKRYSSDDFFVSDKPAMISLKLKPNSDALINYTSIKNVTPLDSAYCKTVALKKAFMIDKSVTKENEAFDNFLTQHGNFNQNDSLRSVFRGFYKRYLNRTMAFLKQHSDDYFSFWYFIDQVAQFEGALADDPAYLKEQLVYLKSVFPAKYTGSIEGKRLIKKYENVLKRRQLQLNDAAPDIDVTGIDGKKISLKNFKGKYVLLDFWATWCGPCIVQLPHIKEIRQKYPANQLEIVGISSDYDSKKLAVFVKEQNMSWLHFYDKHNDIAPLYGVKGIPNLFLVNKDGKIVYNSSWEGADNKMLSKLLDEMH
ncbi:peroxiredoxin [Mucilaginibacter oryzae]|uniref:Peroxiredoxin n=1 Tax=Mucilaginibacter oryzae TaxID=468058 RepID=A0A316HBC3_9SPHI|nr:TlpA disulfide reductase family protein [Mucilaginibacter oryzae]PWK77788.1 peroxiredoxin [Mucilaginibacter oryzae]